MLCCEARFQKQLKDLQMHQAEVMVVGVRLYLPFQHSEKNAVTARQK